MGLLNLFKPKAPPKSPLDEMLDIAQYLRKEGAIDPDQGQLIVWNLRSYKKEQIRVDTDGQPLPAGNCLLIGIGSIYITTSLTTSREVPIVELYTDGKNIIHKWVNSKIPDAIEKHAYSKQIRKLMTLVNDIKVGEPIQTSNMWLKGVLCALMSMPENDRYRHFVYVSYDT